MPCHCKVAPAEEINEKIIFVNTDLVGTLCKGIVKEEYLVIVMG